MTISKDDFVKYMKTDSRVGTVVLGFGATAAAFGHGLQGAHDEDLKSLYTSRPKTLRKPLTDDVIKALRKDPKAVLEPLFNKELKWLNTEAQRFVIEQNGSKGRWLETIKAAKSNPAAAKNLPSRKDTWSRIVKEAWEQKFAGLAPSAKKNALISRIEAFKDDLWAFDEITSPSRARRIFSPRNFKVGGALLAVAGTGLLAYEVYNTYKK